MHSVVNALRENPEIAVFLTLAVGFWFGARKFGSFSLGTVTSTLLAGLLIGQLDIHVAPVLQNTFFVMFLFAVGFSVGPKFFPALKKDGLSQIVFTLIVCASGFLTAYAAAKLMGYNAGLTAGLLAGGMTNSGTLGVATANMHQLGLDPAETASMASLVAIGYAVTYPLGTAGEAWFLSSLAPKLLGIDLQKVCKDYEAATRDRGAQSDQELANLPVQARSFTAENEAVIGHTPEEFNGGPGAALGGAFITRYRDGGDVLEADAKTVVKKGDTVAIAGSPAALLQAEKIVGPEVEDSDLLAYRAEKIDIVVTKKAVAGRTIHDLEQAEFTQYGRPVFILKLIRGGHSVALTPDLQVRRHDVLTVRGVRSHVEDLIKVLGSADRPTSVSDIAYMGAGIVIGCLVGTITVHLAGTPLSLSPSVGSLLAGLIFGYLRSIYRTFGQIPAPGLWVFNNVGLNGFIAAVGLNAGPGLVSGLVHYGIGIFVAGIFVSMIPAIVGVYVGRYVFKFHPAILLGACAGAHTTTAALGSLQEVSQSTVPTLGYTVPYAVGRIVLAVSGVVILLIMK